MKKQISLLFIPVIMIGILLPGCSSKSYYAANNKNHQRFDGWQRETANHLVEINDLEMLIVNLSELANESSVKKEVYLVANEVKDRFATLRLDTKMEAALQRATLSTALSAEGDKYYHRLVNTSKEEFDERYKNMVIAKLTELNKLVDNYIENGHSDRIKALDKKIKTVVEEHLEQLTGKKVS